MAKSFMMVACCLADSQTLLDFVDAPLAAKEVEVLQALGLEYGRDYICLRGGLGLPVSRDALPNRGTPKAARDSYKFYTTNKESQLWKQIFCN